MNLGVTAAQLDPIAQAINVLPLEAGTHTITPS